MIPLRDNIRSRRFPYVTVAIIVACVLVFFAQLVAMPGQGEDYAFRPIMLSPLRGPGLGEAFGALLLSMFMHGSLMHIGGNMLFLWVFGDNVEDRMGHLRYLIFYLAAGVVATLAHSVTTVVTGGAELPLVGASGAIAGVLGAYFVLLPYSRVRTLVFLFFFVTVVDLPAPIFLVYWFVLQLFQGVGSIGLQTGVAYAAHIGGFAAGYLIARAAPPRVGPPPPPPDEYEPRRYYGPPRRPGPPRITRLRIE
ncbi:MAG: rhomboid family intramembrane serine protease [Armatimonadota bacterium]